MGTRDTKNWHQEESMKELRHKRLGAWPDHLVQWQVLKLLAVSGEQQLPGGWVLSKRLRLGQVSGVRCSERQVPRALAGVQSGRGTGRANHFPLGIGKGQHGGF